MKKKIINILILLSAMYMCNLTAQSPNDFSVSLNGFIKTDLIYDSRQTVSAREGHFLLYPKERVLDQKNKDINGQPNFNILSIQSRLKTTIRTPDVLDASLSGIIEAAFFGHTDADINGLRLRLAFVKLSWENTRIIIGQYWHPMFVLAVFPDVVSFNTGVPFQPFSRNPQVRIEHNIGLFSFTAAAYSQRDFSSPGPEGNNSSYLRNSGVPGLHLQSSIEFSNLLFGAGVDFKTIRPRLTTESGFVSDRTLSSYALQAFSKYSGSDFSAKVQATYGENLNDMLMLGGYASYVKNIDTGIEEYAGIKVYSLWTDLKYGSTTEVGLFAGYTKNDGSSVEFTECYTRGLNVDYVYRISPRLVFNIDKFRIAGEVEYTVAAYGLPNQLGVINQSKEESNLRLLTAVYLFF